LLHSAKGLYLSGVHVVLGIGVIAANALAAGWGIAAWARREPSVWFWYLLRAAQAVLAAEVLLGVVLLADDRDAETLHYVYGIAPLVVSLITEGMRVGAAQRELEGVEDVHALERAEQAAIARRVLLRETGIMTVGTLLIVTLALRSAVSV
jgi:hypothetical protein